MPAVPPAPPVELVVHAPPPAVVVPPTKNGSPGRWRKALATVALLAAGGAAGVVGSRQLAPAATSAEKATAAEKSPDSAADTVTFGPDKQASAGVETAAVAAEPLRLRVWRAGRVVLHDDQVAHVCPPAEGVVREAPAKLGQPVAAGQVLAVLDSRELGQAKLEAYKAKIALAAEREQIARTRTTMANAAELLALLAADTPPAEVERRTADKPIGEWRQQLLAAVTRRNQLKAQAASQRAAAAAVAEATLRKSESDAEAAAAAYTALVEELQFQVKQQVRQAELKQRDAETAFDVSTAKLLLFGLSAADVAKLDPIAEGAAASRLVVRAPFAGTLVEKHAVRSERVGPQTQMFVVADLTKVWVQADAFEADLPLVRGAAGRPVAFRAPGAGVPERAATVTYTGDLIDRSSRTLTVTAEADNGDRLLKPGMFVEVGFDAGDATPVLQVPASAVLRHENKPFLFVQTTPDTFRRVSVTLGRSGGDRVEVTDGLKTGDRVVVRGGFVLKSELLKDQMVGE